MTPQAGEEAWGHLLVFIQINHSQTGLFEDKVTGERGQKDPILPILSFLSEKQRNIQKIDLQSTFLMAL